MLDWLKEMLDFPIPQHQVPGPDHVTRCQVQTRVSMVMPTRGLILAYAGQIGLVSYPNSLDYP